MGRVVRGADYAHRITAYPTRIGKTNCNSEIFTDQTLLTYFQKDLEILFTKLPFTLIEQFERQYFRGFMDKMRLSQLYQSEI